MLQNLRAVENPDVHSDNLSWDIILGTSKYQVPSMYGVCVTGAAKDFSHNLGALYQ